MQNTSQLIYKIMTEAQWRTAQSEGLFSGSADDKRDGFIHFSTAAQVAGTLERHFGGQTGLVLLEVPVPRLDPALKWEPSRGGALFPHLYGSLQLRHISQVIPIPDERREAFVPPQKPDAP